MSIPGSIYEITLTWLNEALRCSFSACDTLLESYEVEIIGDGKGFMNQIARLRLSYNNKTEDLPSTVIIKLPSTDPKVKFVAEKLGDNQREVRFYQEVAADVNLRTPHVYYSEIDSLNGLTVLIMEDLSNAIQGDSVTGCSQEEAQTAINMLADFHAYWWESPNLELLDWMPFKDSEASIYQDMYWDAWKTFRQKAGDRMPSELRNIGDHLSQYIPTIKGMLTEYPRTILHGDYRLDNCFLGASGNSSIQSLVVFDWEFCAKGRGTYDVATFISEAFTPQRRRDEEIKLLRSYHSLLMSKGVHDYSFESCLRDYRLSMLEIFIFWIVVGGYCDYTGDRAEVYLHNSLERFNAAINDLGCTEFLSN